MGIRRGKLGSRRDDDADLRLLMIAQPIIPGEKKHAILDKLARLLRMNRTADYPLRALDKDRAGVLTGGKA